MVNKPMQKVLVVDDEEAILELLRYNLEKGGYDVKTAPDCEKISTRPRAARYHDAEDGWR